MQLPFPCEFAALRGGSVSVHRRQRFLQLIWPSAVLAVDLAVSALVVVVVVVVLAVAAGHRRQKETLAGEGPTRAVENQARMRSTRVARASRLLPVFLDTMILGRYYGWVATRIEKHKSTDDYPWLEIIRHAADGLWFAEKAGNAPNSAAMWHELLAATHSRQA